MGFLIVHSFRSNRWTSGPQGHLKPYCFDSQRRGWFQLSCSVDQQQKKQRSRNRRAKGRQLVCPVHQDQILRGNGKKYFLHLLSAEALQQRGMAAKTARLVINAYPVFVLSNEWLEELFCEQCGSNHWCHITKHSPDQYSVRWAPQHLWEQVAHVDPSVANPTVSEYTRKQARRHQQKRVDGKRFYG